MQLGVVLDCHALHGMHAGQPAWVDSLRFAKPSCMQEKPGLRLMQYKSMIFERWQRDPRNPRNQKLDA